MSKKENREKPDFDIRRIRSVTWRTVFNKGFLSWFRLMLVGFVFAFLGISFASQASFVNLADALLGLENEFLPDNAAVVEDLVARFSAAQNWHADGSLIGPAINSLTGSQTWLIRLLGANLAYVERNTGEVIAWIVISGIMAFLIKNVIQSVLATGQYRYVMENRFAEEVNFSRVLAPFHKESIWNLIRTKVIYNMVMLLWSLTVIGGIYKLYQYRMIPFLLAENPDIRWKDAKRISKKMTDGVKYRMFLTEMSFIYVLILQFVPVLGILFAVPVNLQLDAEFYFYLRPRVEGEDRQFLIERGFDRLAWVDEPAEAPGYIMDDHIHDTHEEVLKKKYYTRADYIFMFFVFCFAGWVWEVSLHLVQHQEFVNRGTMYGPWLPIYGTGGVLMILLLNRYRKERPKMVALMILLCGVLEYFGSFVLDFIYNKSYWDYKEMFLNLNGRICLAGLVAFAIGGCFGIYVAGPRLRRFMHSIPKRKQTILVLVLVLLFAVDMICCGIFGFNGGAGVGESLALILKTHLIL